jgi:membrane protein implicated in regulation of membrane protease activity
MNDNWTRENRIKKMTLVVQTRNTYFTSMGVLVAIAALVINSVKDVVMQVVLFFLVVVIEYYLGKRMNENFEEIDDIFKN